jgi:hypothetical protein
MGDRREAIKNRTGPNGGSRFDGRREATLRDRIDRENEHHPVNAEVFVFTIDPIAAVGLRCRPARRTAGLPV